MADVVISAVGGNTRRNMRKEVWATAAVGYQFFLDGSNLLKYIKTTDGGATWGAAVQVSNAAEVNLCFGVWFDQWTAGDSGTLIHVAWFGSSVDDVLYRSLDTNGDTLGTQRTVLAGSTFVSGIGVHCSITKARGGNLYISFQADAGAEFGLQRSTDGGVNWTARTSPFLASPTGDWSWLFPANAADANDVWLLYLDVSTGALTLVAHDDSANTNSSSATIATIVENVTSLTGEYPLSGAIRHSDGHLIVALVTEYDTATADHRVFDIDGTGSIVEKTAIATNIDDHYYPALYIDQATDDIYVAYSGNRSGTNTLFTSTNIFYTKSTDGGTSWSAGDTAYREGANASLRGPWTAPSGPRFYVTWEFAGNLEGNAVNSLDLTPAGNSFTYSATGGMVLSGASAVVAKATRSPVGGIILAGASDKIAKADRSTSGGLTLSGVAGYDTFQSGPQTFEYTAVGGLSLSGASPVILSASRSASGGLTISGVANRSKVAVPAVSGGLVFSGSADYETAGEVQIFEYIAVGGLFLNGVADYEAHTVPLEPPIPEPLPPPEPEPILVPAGQPGGHMNTKKVLDLLMMRLGGRTSPALRANCLVEMALIQETDLEGGETLPWFLIGEGAVAYTTPGERRILLPSDFIREVEDDNLYLVQEDGTYVNIRKVGYDEGRFELGLNPEMGVPKLYSIRGNYIILRPTPDSVYPIRFPSYYSRQPLPQDSTEDQNAWFRWVPDLLLAKTGVIIAGEYIKDTELVTLFGAQQQRAVQRLQNLDTAREESNRSRRMG